MVIIHGIITKYTHAADKERNCQIARNYAVRSLLDLIMDVDRGMASRNTQDPR